MNDVFIKKATPYDISLIRELALSIWPKAFEQLLSAHQIEYMLEMMYSEKTLLAEMQRGVEFFVLNYNSGNIGYAAIETITNQTHKLHKIYVNQKQHGKGLGKFLLKQLEQLAINYGSIKLMLNVNRHNNAVNFYKSQGYKIITTEDNDIGNGYFMNDYVMEKNLLKFH